MWAMIGNVIVITGAAHGIGAEMSRIFASHGAKVALLDLNNDMNQAMAKDINSEGGEAYAFHCDVTKPDELKEVVALIKDHQDLGKVDIVICNAGIHHSIEDFVDLTEKEIRKTIDINVFGVFWTIKAFIPDMLARNDGHIVAVSSVAGHFGERYTSVYSASKFALRGLMESLYWESQENGKTNVRFTTVYPYFTKTDLIQEMNIQSRFVDVLSVSETAAQIVDAVLLEKREAWIPGFSKYPCTVLKGTMTYRAQAALRKLLAVKFK